VNCSGLVCCPRSTTPRGQHRCECNGRPILAYPIDTYTYTYQRSDLISVAGAGPRFAELIGTLFSIGRHRNECTDAYRDGRQSARRAAVSAVASEFQRLFPDDMACAAYLEKLRWQNGSVCPHCRVTGVPFHIATRPRVLTCRKCRRQTGLTVGTVMERSHTPLSTWFWAAYLIASQTPGMSAEFRSRSATFT
jgi:hypothetical protein